MNSWHAYCFSRDQIELLPFARIGTLASACVRAQHVQPDPVSADRTRIAYNWVTYKTSQVRWHYWHIERARAVHQIPYESIWLGADNTNRNRVVGVQLHVRVFAFAPIALVTHYQLDQRTLCAIACVVTSLNICFTSVRSRRRHSQPPTSCPHILYRTQNVW